jgi:amino acid transporter
MPLVKLIPSLKRVLLGRAMRSEQLGDTLLPKRLALPVFASDALSSNAYATEEILKVLALGGLAYIHFTPYIAAAVVFIYFIVVMSYRQNVHAYPSGGGDYEVVTTNLGRRAGVFVASALLIDYVLTVAVSISSAVANIASAIPGVADHAVGLAIALIAIITAMNLRGVRESGVAFAVPTYLFMFSVFLMIGVALWRYSQGDVMLAESASWKVRAEDTFSGAALIFLLARSFSSGTTALTGIEAISNGVPAFQKPKSKNAATTLAMLGAIAMTMFGGITWLAVQTQVKVTEHDDSLIGLPAGQHQKTVIAQIGSAVFEHFPIGFYLITATTALILALAANTAFNGFPVLGSILARDGFAPRQLHTRGDRLAFSNGIITLASLAIILVVIYQAKVGALIQLYILGVFVSFTLSQLGMIKHWTRYLKTEEDEKARRSMYTSRAVNSIGFVMTGTVLIIVLATKFTHGAWIVCVMMPALYALMMSIRKHYDQVAQELRLPDDAKSTLPSRVHAVVTVSRVHKATWKAVAFARASRPAFLEAITVNVDQQATDELFAEWEKRKIPIPLRVLDSPFREITRPIVEYVKSINPGDNDIVIVYVPEYVVGTFWERILHNQSALRLKARLHFIPGVIIASVPYVLESGELKKEQIENQAAGAARRGQPNSQKSESTLRDEFEQNK